MVLQAALIAEKNYLKLNHQQDIRCAIFNVIAYGGVKQLPLD
jgi:hypothetical protein